MVVEELEEESSLMVAVYNPGQSGGVREQGVGEPWSSIQAILRE